MEALTELSWRVYPATALMIICTALLVRGSRLGLGGLQPGANDPIHVITLVRGIRMSIIGLALLGLGGAWAWHLAWLLVLALVFGGEELLETSVVLFVLRRGRARVAPTPSPRFTS